MLRRSLGFTLPEILVAVSIFAIVAMVTANLYVKSFRAGRQSAAQNQIYDDARFVLNKIADEVSSGMIDYDEYYNQNVVIPEISAGINVPGAGVRNYGQNYGRYFSSFFNPGTDGKLGFDCNTLLPADRNKRTCTPLRRTMDRLTGENPFTGKYTAAVNIDSSGEDAFCGKVFYGLGQNPQALFGMCSGGKPDAVAEKVQKELYLISADATQKTILAREKIGNDKYALSILRLNSADTDNDGIPDAFVCAPEFQCRNGQVGIPSLRQTVQDAGCNNGDGITRIPADLPRFDPFAPLSGATDLTEDGTSPCDPSSSGFSKDFVPISPLRVSVKSLAFYITPSENPAYAFAETAAMTQPRVTIVLTIEPNSDYANMDQSFQPLTLIETVSAGVRAPIPAPIKVQ